jgi:predicted nucleotidyltransferase
MAGSGRLAMNLLKPSDVLTPQEQRAVVSFLEKLESELGDELHKVILFGSKARQDGDTDSDIDIMIIVHQDNHLIRNKISHLGARISLEYDVLIGPFMIAIDRWEMMQREKFSLSQNVAREGIPLAF